MRACRGAGRALGLVAALLSAPAAGADPGQALGAGTTPGHWRVVWQADPAHEASILWSTDEPGAATLYLDTVPHGANTAAYARKLSCVSERYTLTLDYHHRCAVQGLKPATRYYFVMQTGGEAAQPLYFVTAPADPDAPFALLFGGDSRTGRDQRRRINRAIARLVEQDPRILALAHGGDYIERGTRWSQWRRWLSDYELTTGPDGRVLPVIPTRGNHEASGPLFDEVWADPGGEGNYFSTTLGGFVLLTLNTETSYAGDQRQWLARNLERAAKGARWITVQYHRPAWPAVKQPSGALQHWVPLFERYGVDVAFESDGHVLKRTVPIRDGARDPRGVVYVGEGGLGVPQRTPDRRRWFLQPPGFAASAHHVQKLTVTSTVLYYEALAPEGRRLDEYRVERRDRGDVGARTEVAPREPASAWGASQALGLAFVVLAALVLEWRRRRA